MATWAALRPHDIVAVILGGGAGTRLFPLTKDRAKPAVPLGGKYRLVDIPISNCLNSELRRIFVLTQFNSSSLHRHIQDSYRFDNFSPGFVEILAAQQRTDSESWYQGTADAVRQNLLHLNDYPHRLVLILSGDQLYRMNFRALLEQHVSTGAEVTVATTPVPSDGRSRASASCRPRPTAGSPGSSRSRRTRSCSTRSGWTGPRLQELEEPVAPDYLPASMGIYVFDRAVLAEALAGSEADFGKHVIPRLIGEPPGASPFSIRDTGRTSEPSGPSTRPTSTSARRCPKFNFYDATAPIFTHARYLPGTKIIKSRIERSIVADGCIINDALIEHSLIGVRSRIEAGATIRDSLIMGADYYETPDRPRAGRSSADRYRPGCPDRADHRGQERPHRRRRAHHARRQAPRVRRAQLLRARRPGRRFRKGGDGHERQPDLIP